MSARVIAVSDDHFGRSLLLAIMPTDLYAISLVDNAPAALALLGQAPQEILLMTAQMASGLGAAFFQSASARRGSAPALLLLSRRTSQRETLNLVPRQLILGYPCTREHLREALQSLAQEGAPAPAAPTTTPAPQDPLWAVKSQVDSLFRHLPRLNHYALLGVGPAAALPEIVRFYQQRMMDFHPDRFCGTDDAVLQEQVTIISKRINAAFQALSRPDTRAAYDRMLAGHATDISSVASWAREVQTAAGRRYVELAQTAAHAGDPHAVRHYLALAMELQPSLTESTIVRLDSLKPFLSQAR
ncbi:MAG: DnaJ domain-containing protein [Myxococcota bacterium]